MIKKCNVCGHSGELTWRDGKYYCAMCGSEIAETEPVVNTQPQAQPRSTVVVSNVTCPICKNTANNLFDGSKYRCALCGTSFDAQQAAPQQHQYQQYNGALNPYAQTERYKELRKEKDKKIVLGIVFIFLFWPASVYFFYKAYKANEEMKAMGY